jgi:histidine phosphotransfer protein HptB
MREQPIDSKVFAELQATAGAEFVAELVDTFLEEMPGMLAELRAALAAADAERFRRAAHSLKSNANTFGAHELAAMARQLELGGLSGDAAGERVPALEGKCARAAAALKALCHG